MMLQLNPSIAVSTPKGDAEAIIVIDYNNNTNTVWVCRMPGGAVLHFWSDDIKIYGNPMDGKGWDIEEKTSVDRIPANARRNMDFITKEDLQCKNKDNSVLFNDDDEVGIIVNKEVMWMKYKDAVEYQKDVVGYKNKLKNEKM